MQQAPVFEVALPFLQWVDVGPALGDAPGIHHLLEKGLRERSLSDSMGGLAGVVGEQLGQLVDRSVLNVNCVFEDGESAR